MIGGELRPRYRLVDGNGPQDYPLVFPAEPGLRDGPSWSDRCGT